VSNRNKTIKLDIHNTEAR